MPIEVDNFSRVLVAISSRSSFPTDIIAYNGGEGHSREHEVGRIPWIDTNSRGHYDPTNEIFRYVVDRIAAGLSTHEYLLR